MQRYIDAEKLKKDMCIPVTISYYETVQLVNETIDDQPTADVRENVRGEWIEITNETEEWYWHPSKCSVCGAEMLLSFDNFCPNCGADMRGGKE